MIYNNNIPKNTIIQTGYVVSTTYVNGVAVCEINSDMSPNLKYTGFFQYLQPGVLCNIPNNTKVALAFSPNKHVGAVTGAVNIIPEDNTTLTGDNELKSGEVALVNIANFNYSIQAKVDSLVAIFKNDSNTVISSTLIGETIVEILKDIISEFNTISMKYNAHVHNANTTLTYTNVATVANVIGFTGPATTTGSVSPTPVPQLPPYSPTAKLVQTDNNYLGTSTSAPECFVNKDGKGKITS